MKRIKLIISLIVMIPFGSFSQSYYTISGIVTDAQSGDHLNGIDIVVKDKETGTVSDYKGAYILYLDRGEYEISYSANGYQKEELKVNLHDDFVQMIELKPKNNTTHNKLLTKLQLLKNNKNQEVLSDNSEQSDKY